MRDIYGYINELRAIPDNLHYYIGANAYEQLLMALEPIIGVIEDELDGLIPQWRSTKDSMPRHPEEFIAVWVDSDGEVDSREWYQTANDEGLEFWNLNSSNLNTFKNTATNGDLFHFWRPVTQYDYPDGD